MQQPFHGLVAAPHTPFVDEHGHGGAIDLGVVPAQAARLARDGVQAVFVAGATGEGASLGVDEKRDLFEAWSEAGPAAGLRVIAQVGGESLRDAAGLAQFAAGLPGVEALGAISPCFYRPASAELVARSIGEVADAAGESPLYYYDIPALTGLPFSGRELARAFGEHVPGLRGIKCSRYEGWHVQDYLSAHGGRYDVLCGTDEALLSALSLGVKGAVGSTYNFAGPLFNRIIAAHGAGEFERARALQQVSVDLVQALASFGYMGAARHTVARLGVPVGPPRLPNAGLDAAAASRLDAALDSLDFDGSIRAGAQA